MPYSVKHQGGWWYYDIYLLLQKAAVKWAILAVHRSARICWSCRTVPLFSWQLTLSIQRLCWFPSSVRSAGLTGVTGMSRGCQQNRPLDTRFPSRSRAEAFFTVLFALFVFTLTVPLWFRKRPIILYLKVMQFFSKVQWCQFHHTMIRIDSVLWIYNYKVALK